MRLINIPSLLAIAALTFPAIAPDRIQAQSANQVSKLTNAVSDFTKVKIKDLPQIRVTSQLLQQLSTISPSAFTNLEIGSLVSPDRYLTIGSFQALGINKLSLESISGISGTVLGNVNLGQLGDLASNQTINNLLSSIPDLGSLPIGEVQPILDIVNQQLGSLGDSLGDLSGISVDQLVSSLPDLGNIALGSLGSSLTSYGLDAIPGLSQLPLGQIIGIANLPLSDLNAVGLDQLSLADFPDTPSLEPNVHFGLIDITLGAKEQNRSNTISGGVTESGFKAVPCADKECPHIEVTDSLAGYYTGKQWLTAAQQVPDGYGFLGGLFGNLGPAGNHPFGKAFRVTIESLDEASGTISLGLRFRWCQQALFVDLGCTPYISPPLPFLALSENSLIFYAVPSNASTNGIPKP